MDLQTGHVARRGQPERLTTMELRALAWLAERAGEDVSHDELLRQVWQYAPSVESRAPYFTIRRLRAKLERDPEQPTHLLTVHGVGYRFVSDGPAPPAPRPARRGNLGPVPRLVGRAEVVEAIGELLHTGPVVGLYGPPGIGASSLAVAVAAARTGEAWVCSLDERADASRVASTVAALLRRQPAPHDPSDALAAVPAMLAGRGALTMVLDDVDPDALSDLVQAWVPDLPELRLIGTHRRRPAAAWAYRVPALPPAAGAQLLRQTAQKLGRSLPDDALDSLREIARRLDGNPLSLEFVAPRLLVQSPRGVADARDLATDPGLDAIIARSWDALEGPATDVLATCGALVGGGTLADLVAVTGLPESAVLDVLQGLTDRCLVRVSDPPPPLQEPRFSVFASVRGFLATLPAHEERRQRARAYVGEHAAQLRDALRDGVVGAYEHLLEEAANLQDALAHPPSELAVRLALDVVLRSGGTPVDRMENARRAVELAHGNPTVSPRRGWCWPD